MEPKMTSITLYKRNAWKAGVYCHIPYIIYSRAITLKNSTNWILVKSDLWVRIRNQHINQSVARHTGTVCSGRPTHRRQTDRQTYEQTHNEEVILIPKSSNNYHDSFAVKWRKFWEVIKYLYCTTGLKSKFPWIHPDFKFS